MRRVSKSLLVLSVVFALNVPAYARSIEPRETNPIVKFLKKLGVKVFGDGLIAPRP
jgi:hypothetical protein